MRAWGKEPVLLDNDFGIMVLRRWQLPHPVQEKESLWRSMHSMNQPAPQDKGFFPFTSWTVPFTLLCLALYPLLLHFQGNHCSKSHYFGHITALHSTSPCASSCRVVCCQHLQASQLLRSLEKGERRWPYTVSSKLYIYLNLSEGQNAGNRECRICHQV